MTNYKIRIEVFKTTKKCPKKLKAGDYFIIKNVPGTEVPSGMCARAFHAVYPVALGMRFSEETAWEKGKGYFDINCPDGMIYRLTRIK
jgi:uncharacterized repeat protein (TIGR04076 family)